jgi:uncharacterized membrane protein HdeD (DUF308 family)
MTSDVISRSEDAGVPWWLVLIEGIALVILGILLLINTGITTVILVQILGIYWLIAGIFKIVSIFQDNSMWGWKLFAGILGIIAGIIVIRHPLWSPVVVSSALIIVLGIEGIIIGIVSIVQAFRGAGWGAGILGAISILIGALLLANLYLFAFSLPWVIGVLAIIGGILKPISTCTVSQNHCLWFLDAGTIGNS